MLFYFEKENIIIDFSEKTGAKKFTETDQVFSNVWHSLEPPGFGTRVFFFPLGSQAAGSGSSRSQAALSSGHGREQQQSLKFILDSEHWTLTSQYHSLCSTPLIGATHLCPSPHRLMSTHTGKYTT